QEPSARYAGSGILLGEQRARELWRQNKVTKVTSHVGCGAAKLYCQQNGLDEAQSDLIASEVLKEWANKEGLEFEFIGQLNRPAELHNARGVFVDCTEKLKANNSPHLPHMFQVTANMSAQEIAEDIKLCFAIATGDHGLGQLIAAEQPFVVGFVSSQENQEKINAIIEELNNQDWLQQQQGRIVVQVASVENTDENKNYALAAD